MRLLPFWSAELDDDGLDGRRRVIARLEAALLAECRRGAEGHWAYDGARHRRLVRAWRHETAALDALMRR